MSEALKDLDSYAKVGKTNLNTESFPIFFNNTLSFRFWYCFRNPQQSPLAVDDIVVILGIVGILLYFLMKKKNEATLSGLNNIYLGVFIIAFVVKLVWAFIESSHPDDVADDNPAVIILVAVLANRFS
ncbi:hypothetical protein HS7_15280 [Sulfolobales archaeon HS-7]|nr:hypothetical protein HS7_15280 [Sulfolobales archaeon HS-7]